MTTMMMTADLGRVAPRRRGLWQLLGRHHRQAGRLDAFSDRMLADIGLVRHGAVRMPTMSLHDAMRFSG